MRNMSWRVSGKGIKYPNCHLGRKRVLEADWLKSPKNC